MFRRLLAVAAYHSAPPTRVSEGMASLTLYSSTRRQVMAVPLTEPAPLATAGLSTGRNDPDDAQPNA